MFSGARASMLRPSLRAAFRQHVRRGYATVQERVATGSDRPWQLAAVGVTVPGLMYLRKGSGAPMTAETARDFAKQEVKRAETVMMEAKGEVESKMKEAKVEAEAKMKEAKVGVESGVESAKETVEKVMGRSPPPPPSMSSSGASSNAPTPPGSP